MALSNRPSLLSIPREIRNLIYKELLYIRIVTPPSPSDPGPRVPVLVSGSDCGYYLELSSQRFPAHSHLNLLLCNHQLYAEFLEFLDTDHCTWEYAKIDCMIEKHHIWPTWTIFPAGRAPKIRNLDIDLRVWDIPSMAGRYWRMETARALSMACSDFLLRLLKDGPTSVTIHDANIMAVDTISIQLLLQAPTTAKELRGYDENSRLEIVGIPVQKRLERLASRMLGDEEVARLKLKYGDKVCEIVVGKGETARCMHNGCTMRPVVKMPRVQRI